MPVKILQVMCTQQVGKHNKGTLECWFLITGLTEEQRIQYKI